MFLAIPSASIACGRTERDGDDRVPQAGAPAVSGVGGSEAGNGTSGARSSGGQGGANSSGGVGGSGGAGDAQGGESPEGEDSGGASSGGASACDDLCSNDKPACCAPEVRCVPRPSACRIDVLADEVGVTYEYADLEREIAASSGVVALSISDTDVSAATMEPPSAARIELRLTQEASLAAATPLTQAVLHPFLVSCDDQPLFVGVVYFKEGAAALRTPVLHVAQSTSGEVVLLLGAWQGAWLGLGADDLEARRRIDRPELRAALCARGVLREVGGP